MRRPITAICGPRCWIPTPSRAFEEKGDIFDRETAGKLRDNIYAAGGRRAPIEAYIAFRGKLPSADALLARRGLADLVPAGEA